jgi:hypothetical protein
MYWVTGEDHHRVCKKIDHRLGGVQFIRDEPYQMSI